MTRAEYLSLRPGDVICDRSNRLGVRVVASTPRTMTSCLGLVKVGKSWTSPQNPTAWYDPGYIQERYCKTQYTVRLQPHVRRWLAEHERSIRPRGMP